MNRFKFVLIVIAVGAGAAQSAAAGTLANCEFFKKGNILHESSGLCMISEKNGNVDIELRNGKLIELTPGKKKNRFKDHKKQGVERSNLSMGKGQKYNWDHKKIIVTYYSGHDRNSNCSGKN